MNSKNEVHVGFSSHSINPLYPVELSGFAYFLDRQSNGVLDNICTTALFLQKNNSKILFITNDLLGLSKNYTDTLCLQISKTTKIRPENIIISCTHTHSAPSTMNLTGYGKVNEKYLNFLSKTIVNNASDATKKLEVALIKTASVTINNFSVIRSNSSCTPITQPVQFISFETKNKKVLLSNFACHPVLLNNINTKISKDFVLAFHQLAEKMHYDGLVFFNSTAANVLPALTKTNKCTPSTGDSYVSNKNFKKEVNKLSETIYQKLIKAKWKTIHSPNLSVLTKPVILNFDIPSYYKDVKKMRKYYQNCFYDKLDLAKSSLPHTKKQDKKSHVIPKRTRLVGIRKFIQVKLHELEQRLNKNIPKTKEILLKRIRIGDVTILTYPLEIPFSLLISLQNKFPHIFIFTCTQGIEGYIYTPKNTKGYEKLRGSLAYNLFPYKKDSLKKLIVKSKSMITKQLTKT